MLTYDQWIEIAKDGNPKDFGDYLIYTIEKYMYVASWCKYSPHKNGWKWVIRCDCTEAEDCLLTNDMVTHWMAPPKEPEVSC